VLCGKQHCAISYGRWRSVALKLFSTQGCARDFLSRDRDETRDPCLRDRDETETFKIFFRDKTETRRCSFRDGGRDLEASKTLGSFNVSLKRFPWRMVKQIDNKKLYGLINSHHGKRFLFVILWVFALHFDNYHWIINGSHHKELKLQCCRHEPLCLAQFASNWN